MADGRSDTPGDRSDRVRRDADDPDGGDEHLDEQERESFPASDPHSDWSGPPT